MKSPRAAHPTWPGCPPALSPGGASAAPGGSGGGERSSTLPLCDRILRARSAARLSSSSASNLHRAEGRGCAATRQMPPCLWLVTVVYAPKLSEHYCLCLSLAPAVQLRQRAGRRGGVGAKPHLSPPMAARTRSAPCLLQRASKVRPMKLWQAASRAALAARWVCGHGTQEQDGCAWGAVTSHAGSTSVPSQGFSDCASFGSAPCTGCRAWHFPTCSAQTSTSNTWSKVMSRRTALNAMSCSVGPTWAAAQAVCPPARRHRRGARRPCASPPSICICTPAAGR